MTSAYEWIITTRSFYRTRIELLSAAFPRLHSLPNKISELFSRTKFDDWKKKDQLWGYNNIPAKAEILKTAIWLNWKLIKVSQNRKNPKGEGPFGFKWFCIDSKYPKNQKGGLLYHWKILHRTFYPKCYILYSLYQVCVKSGIGCVTAEGTPLLFKGSM